MRQHRFVTWAVAWVVISTAGCQAIIVPQGSSNNRGNLEGTVWSNEPGWLVKKIYMPRDLSRLYFYGDGTFTWSIGDKRITGKFSYGAGDIVYFNLNEELAGQTYYQETIVVTGDKLTMSDSDGTSLTFNRRQSALNVPSGGTTTTPSARATLPAPSLQQTAPKPPLRDPDKPGEVMQGEWMFVETVYDGLVKPGEQYLGCTIMITGDRMKYLYEGKVQQETTYKCDFTKKPAHLDITYQHGTLKGKKVEGILQVSEDRLQFTVSDPGQPRPEDFYAAKGFMRERVVLVRVGSVR